MYCYFREFSIGSTDYPQIDIFLYSHHLLYLQFVLILLGEILSWSLMGAKGLKARKDRRWWLGGREEGRRERLLERGCKGLNWERSCVAAQIE